MESAEHVGIVERVNNDGSISETFNEGHMQVEGEDVYCIDINASFKKGVLPELKSKSCRQFESYLLAQERSL